ncbi:unnamed protein product [Mucor circinelloides]
MFEHDEESVREMFLNANKAEYEGLVRYFAAGQRQALIDGMNEKLSQAQQIIADTLEHIYPTARVKLQDVIREHQQMAEEDRAKVEYYDGLADPTRNKILNTMIDILHTGLPGGNMNDLVHEFNWPTLEACQDLGLSLDYYQIMITGTYQEATSTITSRDA